MPRAVRWVQFRTARKPPFLLAWPKRTASRSPGLQLRHPVAIADQEYAASPSPKVPAMIKKVSPAAWRHIHLNGHYTFRSGGQVIDLDAILAGLNLA